jgi:CIC family chloride channel protein
MPRRLLQWRPGETQRFLMLSILIGIFSGLVVVCFHITMDFITWLALEPAGGRNRFVSIVLPAAGAALAVYLIARFFPAASGGGVNDTKAAVYISDGYVPFSAVVGKFLACSLSIGCGNSLGPEDPALHMGAGVASLLGRTFRLGRDRLRLIAPIGAAAGLAAAFNTPITAVLFVIEEVLAGWSAGVLGSIVLSAVSAVVVLRWFLGNQPLFVVPSFELAHPSELIVYAVIGVAGGLLSVAFIKVVERLRERLAGLPPGTRYLQPAAAGLLTGFAGIWLPQVLGAGYPAINSALHDQFPWRLLLILGVVKTIVTLLCFGARTPGGMFAPTLFIGAMIGGGIGGLAQLHWPFPSSSVGSYVLVGMGTFFAGVFRAPMTSIFMVFEVSVSYVIILPVMIANTIAYLISRRFQPAPFFTLIAAEEGVELPSPEQQREAPALRVEDAMGPPPEPVLSKTTLVAAALEQLGDYTAALVADGEEAWSFVERGDVLAAYQHGDGNRGLGEAVAMRPLPRVHPDLSLDAAMRMIGPHPVLPVISRARPHALVGALSLDDIHRAYGIGAR